MNSLKWKLAREPKPNRAERQFRQKCDETRQLHEEIDKMKLGQLEK